MWRLGANARAKRQGLPHGSGSEVINGESSKDKDFLFALYVLQLYGTGFGMLALTRAILVRIRAATTFSSCGIAWNDSTPHADSTPMPRNGLQLPHVGYLVCWLGGLWVLYLLRDGCREYAHEIHGCPMHVSS